MRFLKPTFTTSVICTDPLNTERDILKLKELGHKFLHIDIMDGHYLIWVYTSTEEKTGNNVKWWM